MRSVLFWELMQCILVDPHTLHNFPEEYRFQVLLLLASDNHSDDEVLSQFESHSYSKISQLENLGHIESNILSQFLSQRIMSTIHL
jgi:hypothetical protein